MIFVFLPLHFNESHFMSSHSEMWCYWFWDASSTWPGVSPHVRHKGEFWFSPVPLDHFTTIPSCNKNQRNAMNNSNHAFFFIIQALWGSEEPSKAWLVLNPKLGPWSYWPFQAISRLPISPKIKVMKDIRSLKGPLKPCCSYGRIGLAKIQRPCILLAR